VLWLLRAFALLTLLHDAAVERLKGPDIVRIKLGERADLLCGDVHRSLQHKPGDALAAGRSRQRPRVSVIGGVAGQQADANRFAAGTELTILCGHYKDVDQRVADFLATEEISLGDFVLSGGEPAALAVIDATVRLLPGAMSDLDSARGDSFYERELSAPSYTRPPVYRGHAVPEILLSGDHKRIAEWRVREGNRLSERRANGGDPQSNG